MTARQVLARTATRRAFEVRRALAIEQHLPVCPIDAAERRGVEVWYSDVGSMEGLYVRDDQPRILLPAARPSGRQVFACAHELGHHELGHGTRLDKYLADDDADASISDDEYSAHVFAGAFLMPRAAVDHALRVRGLKADQISEGQVYAMACALGVSYEGLVTHLAHVLRMVSAQRGRDLTGTSLPALRKSLLAEPCPGPLVVVDLKWEGLAIDLAVGELALLPRNASIDGVSLSVEWSRESGVLLQAVRPGISRIVHPCGWSAFARVRRSSFVGLGSLRHQDDPDVE